MYVWFFTYVYVSVSYFLTIYVCIFFPYMCVCVCLRKHVCEFHFSRLYACMSVGLYGAVYACAI